MAIFRASVTVVRNTIVIADPVIGPHLYQGGIGKNADHFPERTEVTAPGAALIEESENHGQSEYRGNEDRGGTW